MSSFESAQFKPGQGGRVKGARNRLSMAFVEALAKEFSEHGAEAIRIMRIEKPAEFIKVIAAILPREFDITTSQIQKISDSELDAFLEYAKQRLLAVPGQQLIDVTVIDKKDEKVS